MGRRISWWDVLCIVRWLPPTSAVYRLQHPDTWQWGLPEHLLAGIYDGIQGGNWQRGGNKHAPRPKPLPRPGAGKKKRRRAAPDEASVPVTDIRDELARRRALYAETAVPDEPQIPDQPETQPPQRKRLTADMVRAARTMAGHGIDVEVIAAHLMVAVDSIERLLAGETYRHIA